MNKHYCMNCMEPLEDPAVPCPSCGFSEEAYAKRMEGLPPENLPLHHILHGKYLVGRVQSLIPSNLKFVHQGFRYLGLNQETGKKVIIWEYAPDSACGISRRLDNGTIEWNTELISRRILVNSPQSSAAARQPGLSDLLIQFVLRAQSASVLKPTAFTAAYLESRYDIFEENGTVYIVSAAPENDSLRSLLELCGTFEPVAGLKLLIPVIRSVADLHVQGLIHGNISIDTIFQKDNRLYLTGLGAPDGIGMHQVYDPRSEDILVCDPQPRLHMPKMDQRRPSPMLDVYQLCEVLYSALIIGADYKDIPRDISREVILPDDINLILEIVLRKGLSLNPADRYPNAAELLAALAQVIT